MSRGTGTGRTTLQELTLRPIAGRQVLVRTEATNLCYSNASDVLGLPGMFGGPMAQMPLIQGHGGVGVVEAVGPEVRRVQVGDRVCVSGTPQCGNCYQCLRGRADMCQFLGRQGPKDLVPIADMGDGTAVYANSHIGGLAELMVTFEEWIVPVFTKASAVELGMVCSCVSVAGLGTATSQTLAAVAPGAIAAIVGCGPLGLSAVQGARIAGASKIIAIDPIRARRELALKVGATDVLDPNVEGEKLVAKVREMSSTPNNRLWSGGRDSGGLLGGSGADFVIEGVGAEPREAESRGWAGSDRRAADAPGVRDVRARRPRHHDEPAYGHDFVSRRVLCHRRAYPSRRSGWRRQSDARHPALRGDARRRPVRCESARHARGADRAHARGLRRGRVPHHGHSHHDCVMPEPLPAMPSSLAPAFLLSMPQLTDPNFSRTVVLLCKHNSEGAFGLVLNRPLVTEGRVVVHLDPPVETERELQVWVGGPVEPQSSWILVGNDLDPDEGLGGQRIANGLSLSVSPDVLRRLLDPEPPPGTRLIVGYSGWGPGQLEAELAESAWLLSDVDRDLIFDTPPERMWETAIRRLGADPATLQTSRGVH